MCVCVCVCACVCVCVCVPASLAGGLCMACTTTVLKSGWVCSHWAQLLEGVTVVPATCAIYRSRTCMCNLLAVNVH